VTTTEIYIKPVNGSENFFAKLKQYRAMPTAGYAYATRYDKRATNFLGAIYLAASVIWLN
jgi:transposase